MAMERSTSRFSGIGTYLLIFFLVMTAVSVYDGGTMINRGIRLIPNVLALVWLLSSKRFRRSIYFILFLSCQLVAAIIAFYYEISWLRETMLILSFASYLMLGFVGLQEIDRIKTNWFLSVFFVLGIAITGYLLFELTAFSKQRFEEEAIFIIMLINNLGLLFMLISALLFVNEKPGQRTLKETNWS